MKSKVEFGPIKWMAIESLTKGTYSNKTDVWSLGVVMYEVISRKEPWDNIELAAILYAIRDGKRINVFTRYTSNFQTSECPEPLGKLMQECWRAEPKERPTCDEIYERLTNIEKELL